MWPWKRQPERGHTEAWIHVTDLAAHGLDVTGRDASRPYVCHPLRNLYIPIESFYVKVAYDFCDELARLFRVLRAKRATIELWMSTGEAAKSNGEVSAQVIGAGAASNGESSHDVSRTLARTWDTPLCRGERRFPIDAEPWFFFDESKEGSRINAYGLDLTQAVGTVLEMKGRRVADNGTIGKDKLKMTYAGSEESSRFGELGSKFGLTTQGSQKDHFGFELEYTVEEYKWNSSNEQWE